jgi:hypothetical protein
LCSLTWATVLLVSRTDHEIGAKAAQPMRTESVVATESVVLHEASRIALKISAQARAGGGRTVNGIESLAVGFQQCLGHRGINAPAIAQVLDQ